jgi:hypothetical protein
MVTVEDITTGIQSSKCKIQNDNSKLKIMGIVPILRNDVPNIDKFKIYFNKKGGAEQSPSFHHVIARSVAAKQSH